MPRGRSQAKERRGGALDGCDCTTRQNRQGTRHWSMPPLPHRPSTHRPPPHRPPQPQVDFLLGPLGLTAAEARRLVLAAPEVLAEKDFELERKWRFIQVEDCVNRLGLAGASGNGVALMFGFSCVGPG